jgi:hypothetical protein
MAIPTPPADAMTWNFSMPRLDQMAQILRADPGLSFGTGSNCRRREYAMTR